MVRHRVNAIILSIKVASEFDLVDERVSREISRFIFDLLTFTTHQLRVPMTR